MSEAFFNPNDPRPPQRVAVVIIERVVDDQLEVLFAQRPHGKVYAGYWEFPGGKVEVGESVETAAIREIDEELGIHIRRVTPWALQRFSYPHAHVELHFVRARDWNGAPQSKEQQAFSWQRADAISLAPLLPALHHDADAMLKKVATLRP